MKTCPWCAEEIKDVAIKCPHCQSSLAGADAGDKVLLYVDHGLIRFGKFAGALLGIFIIMGAALYGYDAKNAYKQTAEALNAAQSAQHEAQKAQMAAQKSSNDLQRWAADEQKKLGGSTAVVDQQIISLRQKLVQIYGREIDISAGSSDQRGDSLVNLALSAQGIQANIDALDRRLRILELLEQRASNRAPEPAATFADLSRTLRVHQVSSPADSSEVSKRSFDLKFALCVEHNNKCEEQGLEAVEKVIYRLDPRWFSNAIETRISRADRFSFEVRVWGKTKVTACIYLKGQDQPVVRTGLMSLDQPEYWGSDPSATTSECTG